MFLSPLNFKGFENKTLWCVPTAYSFITGVPLKDSHSLFAYVQKKAVNAVKGVFIDELREALAVNRKGLKPIDVYGRYHATTSNGPTIERFFKERTFEEKMNPVVCVVTGNNGTTHMILMHMNFVMDNWTKRPVSIDDFPQTRRKVLEAYQVISN